MVIGKFTKTNKISSLYNNFYDKRTILDDYYIYKSLFTKTYLDYMNHTPLSILSGNREDIKRIFPLRKTRKVLHLLG
jgi:hypothetical protein